MELLQLKYFCDAAETQNFSKTAQTFLVPASNISQSIKRLEKELSTPLFDRSANRVSLNEAGKAFYQKVRSALDLLKEAENEIKRDEKEKVIRICVHIDRRIVMGVIEAFRRKYPEVSLITTHTAAEQAGEFDVMITDRDLPLPCVKTKAAEEHFLLAYHPSAFSFQNPVSPEEIQKSPFITMTDTNSICENARMICRDLGFEPHIVLQSEDPSYIRKCIELGLGISIVPEISWRGAFSEQVKLEKIGGYKRDIWIYKRYGMDEKITAFYEMLMEAFSG